MGLFAIPVLVSAGGIGGLGLESVMPQQRLVLRRVLLRVAVVMHRQGHAIGAMPLRHTAQLPQGVLQPRAETGETLGEAQHHVLPVRGRQHEVVDPVGEGLTLNGHPQVVQVGKVGGRQPAGLMDLGEEHFLG
jgi:hypothetical protein